ncbi:hypothetical protein [Klebsiella pneumoniae]|uniref:hypothetical protein n=1 Tax=Klebsiella pneumoniae TaxID=573 RepID=UPI00163965C0|nr:hypothetical protein [Klebsiella pneumoniae]MBK1535869.1 hypothetical protein [Klebsiella pneumoniae]MDP0780167.1 hypothetical protein [Klebsiella pneumoniae]MDP0788588.1 hypothetical protein [Klebsiella pneumoniae]HEI9894688.1 hypothetical protein [Klebsiella pneumoniae]
MSHDKDVLNRFLINTANHTMKVHRDDGIYRHLEFSRNGSNSYRFDLVTWPGYLCVTGDMGTWTFSRIADMFEFFTASHFGRQESFLINPGYWSEKFEAGAGRGRRESPCLEFDAQAFDSGLQQWLDAYLEECDDDDDAKEVRDAIYELKGNNFTTESDAYHALDSTYFPRDVIAFDIWDGIEGLQAYSVHYLWICYAIVWGIERYRTAKLTDKAMNIFLTVRGNS